ncbi:MAG: hypothetical protein P8Y49_07175 [Sulfurovaceae bacterium]|jgi:uncharacterized membrane protein
MMKQIALHLHLFAAIAWIGGSIFMAMIGIFLRDKKAQQAVYPKIGPIFGYYQLVSLVILLITGTIMAQSFSLLAPLFNGDGSEVINALQKKLILVAIVVVLTIIHFIIAIITNDKERTKVQHLISRASSLLILLLNLWILHYAIVIREAL